MAQDIASSNWNKFVFNMAFYADALKYEQNTYAHQNIRKSVNDKDTGALSLPFSGFDWLGDDSNISVGYESEWFGGKYTFKKSNIVNFGAVQGWVKFGRPDLHLKIIAGNDNDFTFADSQGADPGLRVYTGGTGNNWQTHKNPDNITQGNGIALNGMWNDLTVDLAASGFSITPRKTQTVKPGTSNTYGDTEDKDFQYGGRVGYRLGDFGKLNASYIINYTKTAGRFGWDTVNLELAATAPDAEVFTHSFGIFASLKPVADIGATLGYSAIITKYLDSYYSISGDMDTTFPLVWKHAVNLNLKYTGLLNGALRLRNDNSLTIYKDKNYATFDISGSAWGHDYNATSSGKNFAEIQHFFIWNGLGVEYDVKALNKGRKLMLTAYGRNMFRQELASANLPAEMEYKYIRNEIMVDTQVKYFFSEKIHVFAGLRCQTMTTFRSKDLTGQISGFFLDGIKMPRDAVETMDTKLTLSIPAGMILAW